MLFALAFAQEDERAQDLIAQHRWFELRDAKPADRFGAAFVKGAVAVAFNHPHEAEQQLKLALHAAKGSEQLNAVREKLVVLYAREGRMRDAVMQLRAIVKRDPSRADTQSMIDLFAPLAALPNSTVHLPKPDANVPCEVKPDGIWLNLSVNGKNVTWLLDTGLNFSATTEAQARILGVTYGAPATAGEAHPRAGFADRITLGEIEFRNVPLLILGDSDFPPHRQGAIGLPQVIALQALRWTREGHCRLAVAAAHATEPNLAFDDLNAIVRAHSNGKPLDLQLDTGNPGKTQLWPRAKADFPDLLPLEFGGMSVVRPRGDLLGKPPGGDYHQGVLRMDLLGVARDVTLDFRTMTLTAH